jgi:RNA polymerase sigma factor (sigma-70 family)
MTIGPLSHPPIEPQHERHLVARSAADPDALAELHDAWLVRIHAFVARRVWDRRAAEIVVAATFARVFGAVRRDGLRRESFGGVLYRTATAILAERRRVSAAAPVAHEDAWVDPDDGEASAARLLANAIGGGDTADGRRDALGRALLVLPPAQRRILVLAFLAGLEPDELCAVLECSRSTLAIRLRRALRALHDAARRDAVDAA